MLASAQDIYLRRSVSPAPVDECELVPLAQVLLHLPDRDVRLARSHFTTTSAKYEDMVTRIIRDEIGTGEGSSFVIKRTFTGHLPDYTPAVGLSIFRNLLRQETGAYWTFIIQTSALTIIGASPERHITLWDGLVTMTPISGTYRFPSTGPTRDGLISFLADRKEEEELAMVLDEELKMMTGICSDEVSVHGPYLTTMARLAHTGYRLEGRSNLRPSQVLERSMFAPTVTGSPLRNAARVIARYEPEGRSYYGGYAALISREDEGLTIDSSNRGRLYCLATSS